jgi:hypothetical protein
MLVEVLKVVTPEAKIQKTRVEKGKDELTPFPPFCC